MYFPCNSSALPGRSAFRKERATWNGDYDREQYVFSKRSQRAPTYGSRDYVWPGIEEIEVKVQYRSACICNDSILACHRNVDT